MRSTARRWQESCCVFRAGGWTCEVLPCGFLLFSSPSSARGGWWWCGIMKFVALNILAYFSSTYPSAHHLPLSLESGLFISHEPCPKGTFRNAITASGSLECALCPFGKFSANVGLDSCDVCDKGTYSSANGLTACAICPVSAV